MRKGWKQTAAAALAAVMAASLLGGCGQKSGTESEKVEKYTAGLYKKKRKRRTGKKMGGTYRNRSGVYSAGPQRLL